ncbi:MAG: methyltransferase domain-containing protein [Nitrospiraceae bacterium]|nr:MAG: methyltransferase domain-containing protein [Nitrospiraceae bacterium]
MLNIPLADATFRDLRDYIYEKSGIFISDNKKYLIENRLSRILQEKDLKCFEDYLKIIKCCTNGNDLNRLFDAVTTNETYFYREPQQLEVFVGDIAKKLFEQKKGAKTIKIWSAACSTGEEPYTLSIMLAEKGFSPSQFEIYGSDLSEGVLSSAQKAVYNSYSIRNIPETCLKKYFAPEGQNYTLSPVIRKSVKFQKINLIDDKNVRSLRNMDVIFCRNVLIYFDVKSKQKVVSHLYDCLNPGGYLIIGSSESLHSITRAFRPNVLNKVITYQKV